MKRIIKCFIVIFIFGLAVFSFMKKPNNKLNADINRSVSIEGHNLSLESNINIVYYVLTENIDSYTECGVLVWNEPQNSYTINDDYNFLVAKKETETIDSKEYDAFYFDKVAAKQFTDYFYAVAYYKVDSKYYYSKVDRYSLLDYCYNKKGSTVEIPGVSKINLGQMVNSLLDYGTNAQNYFNYHTDRLANATYYKVKLVGAKFSDGFSTMLFPEGTNITVTAEESTYIEFVNWTKDTTVVSTSKAYEFTVTADITLTANFESISPSEGLTYTLKSDNTYKVTGIGTFTGTNLLIPDTYNDKPVTEIARYAFVRNNFIKKVVIPNSIITIGDYAFNECSSLANITIGNGVETIGSLAISFCDNLISIYFGSGLTTIDEQAIDYNEKLSVIVVDPNNTKFDSRNDCNALINTSTNCLVKGCLSTVIPNTVTSIGNYAFHYYENLSSISIPVSVTSIGKYALSACGYIYGTEFKTINYDGTMAQWNAISKGDKWDDGTTSFNIVCTDGKLDRTGKEIE